MTSFMSTTIAVACFDLNYFGLYFGVGPKHGRCRRVSSWFM